MITSFDGMFHFLSNFSPSDVKLDGKTYPTIEHGFQAAKTNDATERSKIRKANTPSEAKRLGRKATLREDWESVKIKVMEDLLIQKFSEPNRMKWLLDTGTQILIEGNDWHDNFWGDCTCGRCKDIPGKNNLGMLLMKIREKLSRENK
jgi:ribA/ribD-fused uncharacterized protein